VQLPCGKLFASADDVVVLFDIDDTLLDHSAALRTATDTLYRTLKLPLTADQFASAWMAALVRNFDRYLAGELSYQDQRRVRVRETIDPTLSDEAADEIISRYIDSYEASWSLFADAIPCLDALSGHRLGIISNGQSHQQRMKLTQTGILARFECVTISEECGCAKPSAEIFERACSSLGTSPTTVIYVGDLYDVDAAGARNAGLVGVWLDRAARASEAHDQPIIGSLSELPRLVEDASRSG
jgi:putative hydrolase of the HAD superfamily